MPLNSQQQSQPLNNPDKLVHIFEGNILRRPNAHPRVKFGHRRVPAVKPPPLVDVDPEEGLIKSVDFVPFALLEVEERLG